MQGIVSLLDSSHTNQVEKLWRNFEEEFGFQGVPDASFPHITYFIAKEFAVDGLAMALKNIADRFNPIEINATGLALFTHPELVLYVPVVRSPRLEAVHNALAPICRQHGAQLSPYYFSDQWLPHITLGHGEDFSLDSLSRILEWFADRPISWQISLDNLAIISNGDGEPTCDLLIDLKKG